MLSIARRAFNHLPERDTLLSVVTDERKLNNSRLNFDNSFSIGLRLILDQISHADPAAVGILVKKPANTVQFIPNILISSAQTPDSNEIESGFGCFLKSCHLCKKRLSAKDDIYMYMGDQGFCSVECRSRQIAMDERKEVEEALNRRVLAQYSPPSSTSGLPKCPEGGNCETCRLLEDLRERHWRRKKAIPMRR